MSVSRRHKEYQKQVHCFTHHMKTMFKYFCLLTMSPLHWLHELACSEYLLGVLEFGNELALSEAIGVFSQIHCGAQLDGGWHSGINKCIHAVKVGDLDHLIDISLRCTVMSGSKSAEQISFSISLSISVWINFYCLACKSNTYRA